MAYEFVEHDNFLYEKIFEYLNKKLIDYVELGFIENEQFLEIAKYERSLLKEIMICRNMWLEEGNKNNWN